MDYAKAKRALKDGEKVQEKGRKETIELKNGKYMAGNKEVTLDTEGEYRIEEVKAEKPKEEKPKETKAKDEKPKAAPKAKAKK